MPIMFERSDGAKILFDREDKDHLGNSIIYGAIYFNGKIYESQPLEQLIAHGYWEMSGGLSIKEWSEELHPRDERGQFANSDNGWSKDVSWQLTPVGSRINELEDSFKAYLTEYNQEAKFPMAPLGRYSQRLRSLVGFTDTYTNGSTVVSFDRDVKDDGNNVILSDSEKEALLTKVADMQKAFPVEDLTIHFNQEYSPLSKASGSVNTELGTGTVMLIDLTHTKEDVGAPGWNMPSIGKVSEIDYALAHEWGHAVDKADDFRMSSELATAIPSETHENAAGLSRYAATDFKNDAYGPSRKEIFAEAFAQHHFENAGKTDPSGIYAVDKVASMLADREKTN